MMKNISLEIMDSVVRWSTDTIATVDKKWKIAHDIQAAPGKKILTC